MRDLIENFLKKQAVYQYAFLKSEQVPFDKRVRTGCRENCAFYGTSWSCPPAVGRIEKCRNRCLRHPEALLFSTFREIPEDAEPAGIRRRDHGHENILRQIDEYISSLGLDVFALSSSVCSICAECGFPRTNCRHADRMHPCMESCGVRVADLAELCSMDYYLGENCRIDLSLVFYR